MSPFSVEDALPQWIVKRYPERGGARFGYFEGTGGSPTVERQEARGSLRVRVGSVCRKCNNEWMSALQTDVRPILEPMLDDTNTPLSHDDQRILAAWAMMTALTLQEAGEEAVIPEEHAHALYPATHNGRGRYPSLQVTVAVGRYTGSLTGLGLFILRPRPEAGFPQPPPRSVRSTEFRINFRYWVVLRIGPVIFMLFGHLLPDLWCKEVDLNPTEGRVRIWPLSQPTTWPRPIVIDDDLFENVVRSIASVTWPPPRPSLLSPAGPPVWRQEGSIWLPGKP